MSVEEDLAALPRHSSPLDVRDFETEANQTGTASVIASLTADTVLRFKSGRSNPIKLAVPAHQSFETAGDGSTQTFDLDHSLLDAPDTQTAVVWFDGDYQGVPEFDTDADTITVDGPGSTATVHVYYITEEPATLRLRKSLPSAKTESAEELYTANLALVQAKNQNEQPEYLSLTDSEFQPFVAADMDVSITIDAPYPVKFSAGESVATNAILQFPAQKGEDDVNGLAQRISEDMASR